MGPLVLVGALAGLYLVDARSDDFWTNQDLAVYHAYGRALQDGLSLYDPVPGTFMPFTYPPFAAYVLSPLALLSLPAAGWVVLGLSVAALLATCWLLLGACGLRGRGRLGLACLLAGVATWWEPVQFNLLLGQVNLLVLLVVVRDLTLAPGSRSRGVGVGLAAGFKLTPGLFIVYFLVTRQVRAFWTSVAAFAATVAVGAVLDPAGSWTFWRGGFAGSSIADVTPGSFVANQSLRGLVVRSLAQDGGLQVTALWLALAVPVAVLGLVVARRAHRAHDEVMALACVGLTTVLVSPVSWSHHWVWVVVVLVAFLGSARRRGLLGSPGGGAVAVLATAAFLAVLATWPGERRGALQPTGLIWHQPWDASPQGDRPEFRWTLEQALAGNAYVIGGCLLLLAALPLTAPARRSRRARRAGQPAQPRHRSAAAPGRVSRRAGA